MPEEHRRNISIALTGKPLSEEHRSKLAARLRDPANVKQRSQARKARRRAPETHRAVHKRLVRDRGSARGYVCVDCSGPANAWTHDWVTWEDVAQELLGKRLTFSTNLDSYEPRCNSCHNRLDRMPAPWDPVGSRRGKTKLTEADVVWIRTSGLGSFAMAETLGVHPATIWNIRVGNSWKDIPLART